LGFLTTLRFITEHPLNSGRKSSALSRFTRWQLGSRLLPGSAVAVPFVNQSRLLVSPGMTGATGNIYTGLHEFEDMAFLLHILRPEDLFVDVGANVGSYTVLAGAAIGARCLSMEPLPSTYNHLLDNIYLNRMQNTVTAMNIGLGREEGLLHFSSGLDTMNHVLADHEAGLPATEVPVQKLDTVVGDAEPSVIKIDVEGFETEVIVGAAKTLSRASLRAVIMEYNSSGNRYGYDEDALHQTMLDHGFCTYSYRPFSRELVALTSTNTKANNTLYIKDANVVNTRLQSAPCFETRGRQI
jgi:FkbM family methyltransferase